MKNMEGLNLKKILFYVVICVFLVMLAACNGSNDASSSDNEDVTDESNDSGSSGDEDVTISFSFWGGDFDIQRMEAIREEFYKVNDNIEVELVNLPGHPDYAQAQMTRMASGDPYDVIQMAEESYSFAARGVLEDLGPYIEGDDDFSLDPYYEVGIDSYTHNGTTYGIPMRLGSVMMFYNKDLFDQHGLDYPDENTTWDEVIEAGEQITNHDEGVFGVSPLGGWWASISQFLHSNGASMLSEDYSEFTMDSPEGIEAIKLMQEIVNERDISPNENQIPEGMDLWTSGNIGMLIDGPWHVLSSQANIDSFDWDMTLAPQGAQPASPTFSNAFHMAKGSEHKEAAWEVIKFWTGAEAQEILAAEHGDTPTLQDVAASDVYLDLGDLPPENFEVMLESLDSAYGPEASLMWSEINEVVQDAMSQIINMNEPVEDIMPGLRNEVEELLEEAERLQEIYDGDMEDK